MKVISINAGSSTLKFKMYEMPEEKVIVSGLFERIGAKKSSYTLKYNGEKETKEFEMKNHVDAFKKLVDVLLKKKIDLLQKEPLVKLFLTILSNI